MNKAKAKKAIGFCVLSAAALSSSACMHVMGTKGAIREWGRYHNGAITAGKASPDTLDPYFETQQRYDLERTKRSFGPIREAGERWGSK